MANPMAPQNKESLFIRMIRLIWQILIECLLSARHHSDQKVLSFKEWGEGEKLQIMWDGMDLPVHCNLMERKRQCPGTGPTTWTLWHPFCLWFLGVPLLQGVFYSLAWLGQDFTFWSKGSSCCSISWTSQWSQWKWEGITLNWNLNFISLSLYVWVATIES